MKIILATPLYPPDIAEPAPYTKEVATRLGKRHEVTTIAYGRLPEKTPGVKIISVDKRTPLPIRLVVYSFALWRAARRADVIYAQNGPSVELPVGIVARITGVPLIVRVGDELAHQYAQKKTLRRFIERFAFGRAAQFITDTPQVRPEMSPLEPRPDEAFKKYERSWDAHLQVLDDSFRHA
ncbi:MAG: glycosyltransferase [bacterium]|nr:glycosyltransferase [bacterium]